MPDPRSHQSVKGAPNAPVAPLDIPSTGGRHRQRQVRGAKLLLVVVTTALLSAVIAAYLLPETTGAWDPLVAAQWLGVVQPGTPTQLPTPLPLATTPADYGTTPFPIPTAAIPGAPVASRADPQGCGRNGAPPVIGRSLTASTRASAGTHGEVAITIDDGPSSGYTQHVIDILRAWNAPATFFVVGVHAQRFPALVQEEAADGFAIGDHTLTHATLPGLGAAKVTAQISGAAAIIRSLTGNNCLWLFRPPYGSYDPTVIGVASGLGFTSVVWDVDGLDWTRPGSAAITTRILGQIHSGAIILIHDGAPDSEIQDRSQTVAALPGILAGLRARGLRPVTLPTLLSDASFVQLHR